jgi:hypothetical protein
MDEDEANGWLERGKWDMEGGLAEATFRKRYQSLWWDTSRVVIGPPAGRRRAGLVGLYAERNV